jgi:hypothetical protein
LAFSFKCLGVLKKRLVDAINLLLKNIQESGSMSSVHLHFNVLKKTTIASQMLVLTTIALQMQRDGVKSEE